MNTACITKKNLALAKISAHLVTGNDGGYLNFEPGSEPGTEPGFQPGYELRWAFSAILNMTCHITWFLRFFPAFVR